MKVHHYDIQGKLINIEDIAEPPEQVAETSIIGEAERALASMRIVSNGTGPMTTSQLTAAVRSIARVLVVLVRLQLRRFDGTD